MTLPQAPLAALLGLLLAATLSAAQTDYPAEAAPDPLSAQEGGARAAGLGGAFTALADDAGALYANPAGLTALESPELAAQQRRWLADSYQSGLSVALPLPGRSAVAAALGYVDWGDFQAADAVGNALPSYHAAQLSGRLAYAQGFGGQWSLGLGLLATQWSGLDGAPASASADLGLLWRGPQAWRVGATWRGLGLLDHSDAGQAPVTLGLAKTLQLPDAATLSLSADAGWEPAGTDRLRLGAEGRWGALSLRAGWRLDAVTSHDQSLNGLSLGAGFSLGAWRVDYAFSPYGDLGNAHQWSLTRRLDPWRPTPKSLPPPPPPAPAPKSLQITVLPEAYDRAISLLQAGDEAGAQAQLLQALAESPGDPTLQRALADHYYCTEQVEAAVAAYQRVLQSSPDPGLSQWLHDYQALHGLADPSLLLMPR